MKISFQKEIWGKRQSRPTSGGALQDLAERLWHRRAEKRSATVPVALPRVPRGRYNTALNSQQGIALIITLILLSVITFMAVTFLVVSRRESEQVTTLSQQNNAKYAATIAADAAQSQLIAQMLANNNGYNFGLLVSTNYINPTLAPGFSSTLNAANITNVGYIYSNGMMLSSNGAIGTADFLTNLANLLILPRAPVFISTNRNVPPDFRYYVDLNRNGKYDTNGWVDMQDTHGNFLKDGNGNIISNFMVGDPEWVGILDHPDMPHSSSNFFVGRYAFIALPIGNSLDFNFMHNQVKQINFTSDGFLRNEGVGSWEINAAGFLNALNGSNWTYTDYEATNVGAIGFNSQQFAFQDAVSLLQYRYNNSYNNLRSLGVAYNGRAANLVLNGYVDCYAFGPLSTNLAPATNAPDSPGFVQNTPWSGDDNPNRLYTTQDLFNDISPSFTNRLYTISTNLDTVNRYTFYNMLSQAGVGSSPEPYPYPYHTKLNLNYSNVVAGSANVSVPSTNFVGWTALQFFTNAAIRLLRSRPEFTAPNVNLCSNGVIYIPIYPTNYYTPAVHRMLQLAANIYDASTNKIGTAPLDFDYPSVFRPLFSRSGTATNSTIIFISGYTNVESVALTDPVFAAPIDLRSNLNAFPTGSNLTANVYGIPYVIGAKPNFPHFNGFSVVPIVTVQRFMNIIKDSATSTNARLWHTNVYYSMSISNAQSVSCWYPSTNFFYTNRGVLMYATNDMDMCLTITNNLRPAINTPFRQSNTVQNVTGAAAYPVFSGTWQGSPSLPSLTVNPNTFKLPLATLFSFTGPQRLTQVPFMLAPTNNLSFNYFSTNYFVPQWALTITNRVRLIMLDSASQRIIDYVQLGGVGQLPGLDTYEDINQDLTNADTAVPGVVPGQGYPFWVTNAFSPTNGVPIGFYNQIAYSAGRINAAGNWQTTAGEVPGFLRFLTSTNGSISNQVPYTATITYTNNFTWSANDPLVHYTVGDLTQLNDSTDLTGYVINTNNLWTSVHLTGAPSQTSTNGLLFTNLMYLQLHINNRRYQPWNSANGLHNRSLILANQLAYQDPLIVSPSDWQFPSNKYPNIGWLGRVHRGTPWQTIFMKSQPMMDATAVDTTLSLYPNGIATTNSYADHPSWKIWTGDSFVWPGGTNQSDAVITEPTNDWNILDLFTTAPNENASRGQLSINQSGFAAWAAILDGVITVTNTSLAGAPHVIDPSDVVNLGTAGNPNLTSAVAYLVNAINTQRAKYTNGGGVFTNVGDILSVPQLTVSSPYLNTNNTATLSDAAYERIPQQILSLLRVGTPRYVIYAYGQSLKPAANSIYTGSSAFGLCTNYAITGEVLTRTVVRFEPTNPTVLGFPPAYQFPNGAPFTMRPVIEDFAVLPPE